jgi:hypothetical protein
MIVTTGHQRNKKPNCIRTASAGGVYRAPSALGNNRQKRPENVMTVTASGNTGLISPVLPAKHRMPPCRSSSSPNQPPAALDSDGLTGSGNNPEQSITESDKIAVKYSDTGRVDHEVQSGRDAAVRRSRQ